MWLRRQGFEKVQSLAGGIDRWARQIDPRVPVY
jgi:rhodanese-related sulfurtransferase